MFPAITQKKDILLNELVNLAREIPEISKQNVKGVFWIPLAVYKTWEENDDLKKELFVCQGEFRGNKKDPVLGGLENEWVIIQ